MTPSDRAPGAPLTRATFDREDINRRLLAVVWHPGVNAIDALNDWLSLIEGVAQYLRISSAETRNPEDPQFNSDELSAMGDTIAKAARIALILAEAAASGEV
ncbi:hypothetical protein [uncultured Lamprocystis sp.]|uniref:hypothetical protein n=1 Tax=uncultured Lamprocystis sp. TaxID=543132 RepID=UPI0025E27547|nr:hypothetical protein [uncultured Lamprocystis sp.]